MAQSNFFDQYDPATQNTATPPAPVYGGPVYGAPPKPDKPNEPKTTWHPVTLPNGKTGQMSSEGKLEDIPGNDAPPPFSPEDLKAAKQDAQDKIETIQRLFAGSNSWFGTGFGADTMSNFGGTNAADVQANVAKLNSAAGLKKILDMAAANGGKNPLAPMSEGDVKTIANSVGNLDISQSDNQFQTSLLPYLHSYMSGFLATGGTNDELKQILSKSEYTNKFTQDENGSLVLDIQRPGDPPAGGAPPPGDGGNPPPNGGGDPTKSSTYWDGGGVGFLAGDYSPSSIGKTLAGGMGDIVHGAGDMLGVVANPLNQTVNWALGTNLSTDMGDNAQRATGLPSSQDPTVSAINRAGASALTGGGMARGATGLVESVPWKNALNVMGQNPVRDAIAGGGGGLAASVAQQNDVGPVGQIMAAIGGGLLTHKLAGGVSSAFTPKQPNALAQASERQGVNMLPADAGGPVAKAITTGTKASPLSVGPVVKAAQRNNAQLSAAAERAANSQGASVSSDIAGLNIRDAANRFTKQTEVRATRLYDRAFVASKGVKIKPFQTLAAVDEQIARLRQNPAEDGSTIKELERFKQNVSEGVTVQGIRDARTKLSQGVFDGKLRGSAEQAMWKSILGNISDDVTNGLNSVGRRDAAHMFKVADKFWSDRVKHIDEVLQPILGQGKSGEEIVTALEAMSRGSRGGNARLSRLLANMSEQEAGNVRATMIDRLGKATAGQQNAEGTQFSAGTFLTNWNKMTPQAKSSLFADKGLRQNLDDIAKISEASKASQAMSNFSNTGIAMGSNIAVGGTLAMSHPVAAILGAGAQALTGKLMASPSFARILARTAKMPPAVAERSFKEQLGVLGTRESALRTDISALLQRMGTAANQSPVRAAASEKEKH